MAITWLTNAGGTPEPWELSHSTKESWSSVQMGASVSLICPWADRYVILNDILYYQKEWPYLPGSGIYAMTGTIGPFANSKPTTDGSGNSYENAQLDINFEWASAKNNAPGGGQAIYSESLEPTAEFLTLPYQDFRWGSKTGDAIQKEEAPGRLEIGCDYTVTWNGLRAIPQAALSLIGAVNFGSVISPSLGLTFPQETLLFNPPKISRAVNLDGAGRFQMVCKWTYKASGWNQFWRAKIGAYNRIHHKDSANPYNNFRLETMTGVLP